MPSFKIFIGTKGYEYSINRIDEQSTRIICSAAKIDQEFLNEDIVGLLEDLPNLILAEKEYKKSIIEVLRFRVSSNEKRILQQKARKKGYKSMSEFLRGAAMAA